MSPKPRVSWGACAITRGHLPLVGFMLLTSHKARSTSEGAQMLAVQQGPYPSIPPRANPGGSLWMGSTFYSTSVAATKFPSWVRAQ